MTMRVTITMVGGEPTPVFWRVQDLREALEAAYDIRLPLTSPRSVADKLLGLLFTSVTEDEGDG